MSQFTITSLFISGSGGSDGYSGCVRPREYSQGLCDSVCSEYDGQLRSDLQPFTKHPRRRSDEFTGLYNKVRSWVRSINGGRRLCTQVLTLPAQSGHFSFTRLDEWAIHYNVLLLKDKELILL